MPSDKNISNADIQKLSSQFQQLQYQADALSQQLNLISASIADCEKAFHSIEEFEGTEDGHEIMIPIGMGTNIMANLSRPDTVVMEIGAGISIEKNLDEAKKSLEIKKEELTKFHQSTQNNLNQIVTKMQEIESVVTTAVKAQQRDQEAKQKNQGPLQGS